MTSVARRGLAMEVTVASRCRRLIMLSALSLLPAAALPAQPASPLKAEDAFNLELATDPRISPDGRRIVYVRRFADIMSDRRYSNLWIVGADGRDHRPLTTGKQNDTSPRWSPDGTRLAYISERDGRGQVVVRYMDDGQTLVATNLESEPGGLSWSPDGTQIAFVAWSSSRHPASRQCPRLPPARPGPTRR